MAAFDPLVRFSNRLRMVIRRLRRSTADSQPAASDQPQPKPVSTAGSTPKGTFTNRHDVDWVKREVGSKMPVEILTWRSASVKFLRAVIFPWLGGRYWLRLLFWLEERKPHYFGEKGQYPLIVIRRIE
jgi:hypothetical protein